MVMTDVVVVREVLLPDGRMILAQVIEQEATGPVDVTLGLGDLNFGDVTDTLEGIGSAVLAALGRILPDKATVEFGLDLAVQSGKLTSLLVGGEASASLKVTLEWSRQDRPATPPPAPALSTGSPGDSPT